MDNSFCELSVSDFKKKITEPDSVLIDIRTKEEWEKYGVIPETDKYIVFGHPLFEYQIDNLDKEANYLIYCWHGNRTKQVIDIMRSKSFISVKDLGGGIDAWIRAGEEVVSKRKF